MKKLFGCVGALLLIFIAVGSASAGNLYLTANQMGGTAVLSTETVAGVYYPGEAVKGNNDYIDFNVNDKTAGMPAAVVLRPGAVVTRSIVYKPTTDLPSGTRIVFTLTNGLFADSKMYLMKDVNPDPATPNPNGDSLAASDAISGGTATFIVGNQPVPANTLLIMSTQQDTEDNNTRQGANIRVIMTSATAGVQVLLSVTQCFDAVGPIAGGLASGIPLIENYTQFTFDVEPGYAVINVEADSFRTRFLCAYNGCDSYSYAPSVTLTDQQNNYGAAFAIDLNYSSALANIQYAVTGNQLQKLDDLYLYDTCQGFQKFFTIASNTTANVSFAANSDYNNNQGPWYNSCTDALYFIVDGSVLNPQTFNISGALNFANDTDYNDVNLTSRLVMTWDINGWQGTLPYMFASGTQATDTFIKIFNDSDVTGDVTVDVTQDSGAVRVQNLQLGQVPARTVGIFWAGDIATLAGLPLDSAGSSFAALFTVNAPQNAVTAVSVQKRASGAERVLPIYTDESQFFMDGIKADGPIGGGGYKHW
jgi:hypothetical protein